MVSKVPAVNTSESGDHFHIEMAAPGLKKEDFKISLDRDQLTISVEQQSEKEERGYNKCEFSYSSFVRSFTLPDLADQEKIEAAYQDGVLKIDIAKREEAKAVRRQIEIK